MSSVATDNPFDLLVCDSDALIQILCSDSASLLKKLKRIYGIQSILTEAVDDELTNPRHRLATEIQAPLQKALGNETLILLDQRSVGRFTSNDPYTTYSSIHLKGQEYHKIVQRGEAYTHASAIVLRAAVLTNDAKAIRALDRSNKALPKPILRAYDIIALFHQRGDLEAKECDQIRKRLVAMGDTPHVEFEGCKFTEGLTRFYPRLVDQAYFLKGSSSTRELGDENRVSIK